MSGLTGKILLSTCSEEKAQKIVESFRAKEVDVYNFPMAEITKAENNRNIIENTLKRIDSFNWIIFTSSNGVNYFFHWLNYFNLSFKKENHKFAVIGKATGQVLNAFNIDPDYISGAKDSKAFAFELYNLIEPEAPNLLVPTGNLASQNLKDVLGTSYNCEYLTVYNTTEVKHPDSDLINRIKNEHYDWLLFMSPSAVNGLFKKLPKNITIDTDKCIAIGNTTRKSLKDKNINPFFIPSEPNIDVLAEELEKFYKLK